VNDNPVPPFPCPGGNTFCIQLLGNPVKSQSVGPKSPHAPQSRLLSLIAPKRLPALTAAIYLLLCCSRARSIAASLTPESGKA